MGLQAAALATLCGLAAKAVLGDGGAAHGGSGHEGRRLVRVERGKFVPGLSGGKSWALAVDAPGRVHVIAASTAESSLPPLNETLSWRAKGASVHSFPRTDRVPLRNLTQSEHVGLSKPAETWSHFTFNGSLPPFRHAAAALETELEPSASDAAKSVDWHARGACAAAVAERVVRTKSIGAGAVLAIVDGAQRAGPTLAKETTGITAWAGLLLGGLLAQSVLGERYGRVAKVELPDDPELVAVRGRPCWVFVCVAVTWLLTVFAFWVTFLHIEVVNHDIKELRNDGVNVVHPVECVGERSFEAGQGVALSVCVAVLVALSWRRAGDVKVSAGLLGQFAVRGATLSMFVAGFLEIIGSMMLTRATGIRSSKIEEPKKANFATVFLMIIVGISEEFAKIFAVTCGTWLAAAAILPEIRDPARQGCCGRCWRVLIESPRALMLAGLCAGFGFMTMENVGYLFAVAVLPEIDKNGKEDGDSAEVLRVVRIVTILARVLLNIHPWLTGISAGRVAQVAFGQPPRTRTSLSCSEYLWAFAPSAAAHASYDGLLTVGPTMLVLFVPPTFFYASRASFIKQWETVGQVLPPTDDVLPRTDEPGNE